MRGGEDALEPVTGRQRRHGIAVGAQAALQDGAHIRIVFHDGRKGCPLWYYGDADYERAHTEADNAS